LGFGCRSLPVVPDWTGPIWRLACAVDAPGLGLGGHSLQREVLGYSRLQAEPAATPTLLCTDFLVGIAILHCRFGNLTTNYRPSEIQSSRREGVVSRNHAHSHLCPFSLSNAHVTRNHCHPASPTRARLIIRLRPLNRCMRLLVGA
jgi:hypothetical protein